MLHNGIGGRGPITSLFGNIASLSFLGHSWSKAISNGSTDTLRAPVGGWIFSDALAASQKRGHADSDCRHGGRLRNDLDVLVDDAKRGNVKVGGVGC